MGQLHRVAGSMAGGLAGRAGGMAAGLGQAVPQAMGQVMGGVPSLMSQVLGGGGNAPSGGIFSTIMQHLQQSTPPVSQMSASPFQGLQGGGGLGSILMQLMNRPQAPTQVQPVGWQMANMPQPVMRPETDFTPPTPQLPMDSQQQGFASGSAFGKRMGRMPGEDLWGGGAF